MPNPPKAPIRIAEKIRGVKWSSDLEGKSEATVLLSEKMVLKVEKISRSSAHEIKLLNWLDGKLPVPKIIDAEEADGYSYLLMSKLPGDMVCTGNSLKNMEASVTAIANGLKAMWQLDISDCPCLNNVSEKLIQAKLDIENNRVDINNFDLSKYTCFGQQNNGANRPWQWRHCRPLAGYFPVLSRFAKKAHKVQFIQREGFFEVQGNIFRRTGFGTGR